jgi:hypothetical protein
VDGPSSRNVVAGIPVTLAVLTQYKGCGGDNALSSTALTLSWSLVSSARDPATTVEGYSDTGDWSDAALKPLYARSPNKLILGALQVC